MSITVPQLNYNRAQGVHRAVFDDPADDVHIIKVALWSQDHCGRQRNLSEHQLWTEVQHTPLAQWFAPVQHVHAQGHWLRQVKAAEPCETVPDHAPDFVHQNSHHCHMIGDRCVLVSYSTPEIAAAVQQCISGDQSP